MNWITNWIRRYLPDGAGKAIMEQKCTQCHFLWRPTQMRWTHDNWEKKIFAWMRERIHENKGAVDLTDQEAKIVVDYLAANYSDKAPKADPNGRLSRTPLQGAASRYVAVDFAWPNPDAALTTSRSIRRALPGEQLNVYKLGKFDPKTFEVFRSFLSAPGGSETDRSQPHGSARARRRGLDLDGRGRRQSPLVAVRHQVPASSPPIRPRLSQRAPSPATACKPTRMGRWSGRPPAPEWLD